MADHIIPLPSSYHYLNQFASSQWAPKPSKFRCVTASVAMLAAIAYPGRWVEEELEHDLYVKFAGPDIPSDENGIAKQPVLDWFHSVGIGFYDMASLLGDTDHLREVLERQNSMGIPQLITVADESFLHEAKTGAKLHNWADQGMSHAFIRLGYSDTDAYGLYDEPAAPGFHQPVAISWSNSIVPAHVITAVAVYPNGMPAAPADFDWLHNTWPAPPAPKPTLDVAKALNTLQAIAQVGQQLSGLASDLAKDVAALRQEV